ncbi:hypothetical protein [Thalassovita taeanensis]|uniref:Uncharacterized protein n=1 Tax=Thalassovita taeanensis TaxID=657014 RepID=A0A1H9D5C8_9RHOB|nr:hypothetical protein [Thalassovita taeanensis]SEQ08655.1 hypothetical protein SAMN04488092_10414 [Thalassovita taeanensis]
MDSSERDEKIREIVSRFYDSVPTAALGIGSAGLDVSKPNQHDSKADFLAEKIAVDIALEQADGLFGFFSAPFREDDTPNKEMAVRIAASIDAKARVRAESDRVNTALELIVKNAGQSGVSFVVVMLLFDVVDGLRNRKQELGDQEAEFWSGHSRPPNHYARTIALRFARAIATKTGRKPTFGTSRDGGHPSTDFGRALEELFKVLEIKANVKRAAVWAIDQITEEDLKPPVRNALSSLYLADDMTVTSNKNALSQFARLHSKASDQ